MIAYQDIYKYVAEIERHVYHERPRPITDLAVDRQVSVAEYGARPDSGDNALPAIARALADAHAAGVPTEIVFPPGRYILSPDFAGPGHCLSLEGAQGLVLTGEGARLVLTNPLSGLLRIANSRDVIVRGFEVDYDPLPFTQGLVKDVHLGDGSFDLAIEPGFLGLDTPLMDHLVPNMNWRNCASWGMLKDPEIAGRLKAGCPNVYFCERIEHLGDKLFRVTVRPHDQVRHFEPGDRYVHLFRAETSHACFVYLERCERVTFAHMRSYASSSWAYHSRLSSQLGFIDCAVPLIDGRWHTLDSDGINTSGGRIGPWIEDCLFEAGADDTLVSHAARLRIEAALAENKLRIAPADPYTVRPEDQIIFYNPRDGAPLGQAAVDHVDYEQGLVTFRQRVPKLRLGLHVALDDRAINLSLCNGGFVFRGNTVRNSRRWPVWTSAPALRYGAIEKNLFEGMESAAINMIPDVSWSVPRDIVNEYALRPQAPLGDAVDVDYGLGRILIRDNVCRECGFNGQANLWVGHRRIGNQPSPWQPLRQIIVTGNRFENWAGRTAIDLANVRDIALVDNEIVNNANRYHASVPVSVLRLDRAREVLIAGNTVTDDRAESALLIAGRQVDAIEMGE